MHLVCSEQKDCSLKGAKKQDKITIIGGPDLGINMNKTQQVKCGINQCIGI